MKDVTELIKDREVQYGNADVRWQTIRLMFQEWDMLTCEGRAEMIGEPEAIDRISLHAVYMIIDKLTRLAVSPNHLDSWRDIQGYARLAESSISKYTESDQVVAGPSGQ